MRHTTNLQKVLDRLPAWAFVVTVIVMTVAFAEAYYRLSKQEPNTDGLIGQDKEVISRPTAIYFSIVTEATLGYGDVRPIGLSRALICVQVIAGLVLAGLCIAKLQTLQGSRLRALSGSVYGEWTDYATIDRQEQNKILGFDEIVYESDTLVLRGRNFDDLGHYKGFCRMTLVRDEWPLLVFGYSNEESSLEHFVKGEVRIVFDGDLNGRESQSFHGTGEDFVKGETHTFVGFRRTQEDRDALKSTESTSKRVRELATQYWFS